MRGGRLHPLITRDPASGEEFVVTRLEAPQSGIVIEGRFALGWIGKLAPEQLDFLGLLLRNRNNLQKLASDLGLAYNTIRSRFDEIVDALGGPREEGTPEPETESSRTDILTRVAAKEMSVDEAVRLLRRPRRG